MMERLYRMGNRPLWWLSGGVSWVIHESYDSALDAIILPLVFLAFAGLFGVIGLSTVTWPVGPVEVVGVVAAMAVCVGFVIGFVVHTTATVVYAVERTGPRAWGGR